MTDQTAKAEPTAAQGAQKWVRVLAGYRDPSHTRSIVEIGITLVPFLTLWALTWAAFHFGYWWISVLLWVPAAGFLLRLFAIQHDCGHGAFFRHRQANDWVGRVIGVLTLTPYDVWRRAHSIHHAGAGSLDRRGQGDIETLTVREYQALSRLRRAAYRLYRSPFVLFGVGPAYQYFLRQRLPLDLVASRWHAWFTTMATNLATAVVVIALIWFIGIGPFLMVHLPITLLAATAGVWLFFVQHQFEGTFWAKDDDWNVHEAALHGSSYYDLPHILNWFSANIGIHHVHHLSSRIPFYRLPQVLRDHPDLKGVVNRLTLLQSFGCARLVLWDETQRRLVSFREARALAAA